MKTVQKQLSQEAIEVLKGGRTDGNNFFITNPQLERKLYVEVNEALENFGGTWNRKLKCHVFPNDPTEALSSVLENGSFVDEKKTYQFFETPKEIVRKMIDLADLYSNEHLFDVMEPSAGLGAIADEIDQSRCLFRCCEIDPKKVDVLIQKGFAVFGGDFLSVDEDLDRIVMNPPFSNQQDIDHVNHAYKLLRKGGRLVSVMSPGFTFRTNSKSIAFNKLVSESGWYEDLPDGAFEESGTNVKTVLVVLNKK